MHATISILQKKKKPKQKKERYYSASNGTNKNFMREQCLGLPTDTI
jgi:hypothetical protein